MTISDPAVDFCQLFFIDQMLTEKVNVSKNGFASAQITNWSLQPHLICLVFVWIKDG